MPPGHAPATRRRPRGRLVHAHTPGRAAPGTWCCLGGLSLSAPRSGQHLRETPRRIHRGLRAEGSQIASAESDGKCHMRTADWHHAARVPGLGDSDLRGAPTTAPQGLGRPFQQLATTHGLGTRRARPAIHVCRIPFATISVSRSRGPRRAREIGAGRVASRIFTRACGRVIGYLRTTAAPTPAGARVAQARHGPADSESSRHAQ